MSNNKSCPPNANLINGKCKCIEARPVCIHRDNNKTCESKNYNPTDFLKYIKIDENNPVEWPYAFDPTICQDNKCDCMPEGAAILDSIGKMKRKLDSLKELFVGGEREELKKRVIKSMERVGDVLANSDAGNQKVNKEKCGRMLENYLNACMELAEMKKMVPTESDKTCKS